MADVPAALIPAIITRAGAVPIPLAAKIPNPILITVRNRSRGSKFMSLILSSIIFLAAVSAFGSIPRSNLVKATTLSSFHTEVGDLFRDSLVVLIFWSISWDASFIARFMPSVFTFWEAFSFFLGLKGSSRKPEYMLLV